MNRKLWWLLIIVWCIFIFTMTESPQFTGESTRSVIEVAVEKLNINHLLEDQQQFVKNANKIVRKLAHFTFFGVLAILLWKFLPVKRYKFFVAWMLTTIFAISDEWHQSFQPNRTPTINDVFIDSVGALVLLGVVAVIEKRRSR
jgi:VanZ family protein